MGFSENCRIIYSEKNGLMFALLFFNLKITQYQNFCEYHSMKKHWHDYLF